jgi:DNA gyrase subunit A
VLTLIPDELGRPIYRWKTLSEIEEGDYVVVERGSRLFPKQERLSPEQARRMGELSEKSFFYKQRDGSGVAVLEELHTQEGIP